MQLYFLIKSVIFELNLKYDEAIKININYDFYRLNFFTFNANDCIEKIGF